LIACFKTSQISKDIEKYNQAEVVIISFPPTGLLTPITQLCYNKQQTARISLKFPEVESTYCDFNEKAG